MKGDFSIGRLPQTLIRNPKDCVAGSTGGGGGFRWGNAEVLVHQKTGWLVEKEDSVGLAQALTFLLEHPEVARQMGQTARQRAQEVFSMQRCIDVYDTLYQKLGKKVAFVPAYYRTDDQDLPV